MFQLSYCQAGSEGLQGTAQEHHIRHARRHSQARRHDQTNRRPDQHHAARQHHQDDTSRAQIARPLDQSGYETGLLFVRSAEDLVFDIETFTKFMAEEEGSNELHRRV